MLGAGAYLLWGAGGRGKVITETIKMCMTFALRCEE